MSRRARRSYASDDPPRTPRAPVILPNGLNLSAFAFNPEAAAAAALQRQRTVMNAAMDTDEEESQSASGDTVDSDEHHVQALGDSHPSSGGTADKGVYSGEEVAPDSSLGSHRPTQGLTSESMNQGSSSAAREDNPEATDPADDLDDPDLTPEAILAGEGDETRELTASLLAAIGLIEAYKDADQQVPEWLIQHAESMARKRAEFYVADGVVEEEE
ncbi:uncharacterized protein EHS24_004953 [Apiotrichum porosum]|uniref:Uncharacterized protein n=1 Tax=Apiotrichum porosum TaxID=105984 RepID=A0A427Y6J0_9TREE|nr:uncharacterized protein EHS24_004953 [Apiotrichum porosum]RSH86682.1 hypothetical protein EHS24_004953 [Apiotrichum porosum]